MSRRKFGPIASFFIWLDGREARLWASPKPRHHNKAARIYMRRQRRAKRRGY